MAEVLLFHHALGPTDGLRAFADDLRAAGHTVHAPDLFEGRTFTSIDDGVAYAREVGWSELATRADRVVESLPDGLVYAGFSLGVVPAQRLAQTRPGAKGAVFFSSALPPEEYGGWPAVVPVQIHSTDADPYFIGEGDVEAAREIIDAADDGELFLYPGDEHYFTDSSLPSYDAAAARLVLERVLGFLDRVG